MYYELQIRKSNVWNLDGNNLKEIELPLIFSYPVRKDLIRRAFYASLTRSIQPKARDPMAGKRTPASSFGINLGLARVPRIRTTGEGALAPNTVGGRAAFPPTLREKIVEEINEKEKRLAVISAISATADKFFVSSRGHKFSTDNLPVIVADDLVNISKPKELLSVLDKIKVIDDIYRVKNGIKIRAGKGKMRGRKYKVPVGPLIVSHDVSKLLLAAKNIPGVDVVNPNIVSVIHLAPGAQPGRLTIYTESSLDILNKRLGGLL
jgi:large subunit ribosomal protein L4e